MVELRQTTRQFVDLVRDIVRVHVRTIVPLAIVVISGIVVLTFLAASYAQIIGVTVYQSLIASISSIETWTIAVAVMLTPLLLLALFAGLTWAGVATQLASTAIDKKSAGLPSAVGRAIVRAPRALAVIVVILGAAVGAIIAAPVFLIVGVVGLIARRGDRERLVPMAIPFGVAALVVVRWALTLPGVWLDGLSVRAALAESSNRVRGQSAQVAVTMIVALLVNWGVSAGIVLLIPDPVIAVLVQLLALVLFGGIPFVAMTVLYRRASEVRPAPLPAPLGAKARVAAVVTISMVVPMAIGVAPGPAVMSAQAAPGTTVALSQYLETTITGQGFALDVQVTGVSPTGDVRLEAEPTTGPAIDLGTYPINGAGYATAWVGDTLPADEYELVGYYLGDGTNAPAASTQLPHAVTLPVASIDVASTAGATGDTVILTVTVTPQAPASAVPTGTVSVNGGTEHGLDGSGGASFSVDVAAAGTRELTVTYTPASYYGGGSTLYTVPRLATTVEFVPGSAGTFTYGETQTFDGEVVSATGTVPTGTVDLLDYYGDIVATTNLVAGRFSFTVTTIPVQSGFVGVSYDGDATHAPSRDSVAVTVTKAIGKAVLSISPSTPAVGDTIALMATLPALGDDATGTVSLETPAGSPLTGPITIVGGVASTPWVVTATSTSVRAVYAGDRNFSGATSDVLTFSAGRAPVTVTIADPGPVTFGNLFTLSVEVKVGDSGLQPDHGIDFFSPAGTAIASNVPLIYNSATGTGVATLDFCARSTGCPVDTIALGSSDRDIVAVYGEDSLNLEGQDTYEYRPSSPTTTTTLVVTPAPGIVYGSGVNLRATVSTTTGATPTGVVSFFGVKPDGSQQFLKMEPLTAGVAEWTTSSGDDPATQLVWPQDKVLAVYNANGAPFQNSTDEVTVELGRMGTYVVVDVGTPILNTPATVTATLSHEPGVSADYRGFITITSDTGHSCTRYLAAGSSVATCIFTWTTNGSHKVTTSYSNTDPVYLPIADTDTTFAVGTVVGTPVLSSNAPSTALVGEDVTVTWSLYDASMTGDVTVWGDGTAWCTVPVATGTCTGQFGIASATGSLVDIRVRYDGDANWHGVEEIRKVTVTRCVVLDVRGNDSTLGSVRVDTAPNCGASGYYPGTVVRVTATPTSPGEFDYWAGYRPPAPDLVSVSSTASTTFLVTTDTQTWVHVAQFRVPCSTVSAVATGNGGISVYPSPNCTAAEGAPGYLYGTQVSIYPDGYYNSTYDEADAFRSFGALPVGATLAIDSAGRPYVSLTVSAPAVVPVTFGPVCRPVTVAFGPTTAGDSVTLTPVSNCLSPIGNGYLRGTKVTVAAVSGDPTLAISGWLLNGQPASDLSPTSDPVIVIDQVAPALTATLVHCYIVDVEVDGLRDRFKEPTGEVRVAGTACPDGSDRYLGGTTVTITPRVLVKGTLFNGWNETRIAPIAPDAAGIGDVTAGIRTITALDRDYKLTAGFFDKTACSRLTDAGAPGLLSFEFSGCGPGYYFDTRKQQAALEGVDERSLTAVKNFNTIGVNVDQSGPLGVYVSVEGDTPDCNGAVDREGFENLGLVIADHIDCRAAGDVVFQADVCQPVITNAEFIVEGREGTYGVESMPGTFNVTGPDGLVSEVSEFQWGQAMPVKPVGSQFAEALTPSGPCGASPNLFGPNTDILLYAAAPSSAFEFLGWTGFGNAQPILPSPMHRITTDDETSLTTGALYTVKCHTVTLGPGIRIDGDAPRCPGSSPADNSYIAGVAIKLRASYWLDGKSIEKFTSGVVGGQIYEDPATLDWVTYAFVDSDKHVSALYQNSTQRVGTEIAKSLKVVAGVVAIVAPVILGMWFPPVGIFFGIVGTAAGIAGFIPGADKAAAVFDLINPTKITTCLARWSFGTPGGPSGGNYGAMISTGKTAGTAVFTSTDVLVRNIGPLGIAGSSLAIGYGLYDAGIGGANLVGPQSVEELADESTLTGCLDQQWRITGSNLSGTGVPAGGVVQQQAPEPGPTGVSVPPTPTPEPTGSSVLPTP